MVQRVQPAAGIADDESMLPWLAALVDTAMQSHPEPAAHAAQLKGIARQLDLMAALLDAAAQRSSIPA